MMDWETILRRRYPAPETAGVASYYFSLDGGGRELITDLLNGEAVNLMVEIGSFLCGSTIQWLEARSQLQVIAVDPWDADFARILDRYRDNPLFAPCFSRISDRDEFIESVRQNGPYVSAMANVQDYGRRVVPVRAHSPQVLSELAELKVDPQLIYFDSNKLLDDLTVARDLFPDAILCGDDWTWGADQGFPVQKAVNAFCSLHSLSLKTKRATWAIVAG